MNHNSTAALIASRGRSAMLGHLTYEEDILLTLPEEVRPIIRQEWTYRMNTSPGWRPSDLLRSLAKDYHNSRTLWFLNSDVARAMAMDAGL